MKQLYNFTNKPFDIVKQYDKLVTNLEWNVRMLQDSWPLVRQGRDVSRLCKANLLLDFQNKPSNEQNGEGQKGGVGGSFLIELDTERIDTNSSVPRSVRSADFLSFLQLNTNSFLPKTQPLFRLNSSFLLNSRNFTRGISRIFSQNSRFRKIHLRSLPQNG